MSSPGFTSVLGSLIPRSCVGLLGGGKRLEVSKEVEFLPSGVLCRMCLRFTKEYGIYDRKV